MPEKKIKQAPQRIKAELPEHAQHIYVEAYDRAYDEYADPGKRRGSELREAVVHKVAWSAVEKEYQKGSDGKWYPRPKAK